MKSSSNYNQLIEMHDKSFFYYYHFNTPLANNWIDDDKFPNSFINKNNNKIETNERLMCAQLFTFIEMLLSVNMGEKMKTKWIGLEMK